MCIFSAFLKADKLLHLFSSIWVCNIDTMKMYYMNAGYLHDLLTSLVWVVMGNDCHCYQFLTNRFRLIGLIIRSQILYVE